MDAMRHFCDLPTAATASTSAGSTAPGQVVLRDAGAGEWLAFESPRQVLVAKTLKEVVPLLREAERAASQDGLYAAGLVSYEAAPAFDARLPARSDGTFPYLWFGLFDRPRVLRDLPVAAGAGLQNAVWRPSIAPDRYRRGFDALREYIRNGDTYQVNFTYRLRAALRADPWAVFLGLARNQEAPYAAFVDAGDWAICSVSPELFFRLAADVIESRPMKGTAARGLWPADDRRKAADLRASEKERAENLMIVDMVRNDLGRVAAIGTVHVPELFSVERYPTVWQMTSTVRAQTREPLHRIFQGLFPPASVVGVPRRRAMEIIAELETTPRRVYTGAIGYVAPGRRAQFNVAIRTLLLDRAAGLAEYGVGGGIVWDSQCARELQECKAKARVLDAPRPDFELLETLLWAPPEGYALLRYHLERLARSAEFFGFSIALSRVTEELDRVASRLPLGRHRVRLLLDRRGNVRCEAGAIRAGPRPFPDVGLAAAPVDREDVLLYHKTTHRAVYERALSGCPGFEDVLLYNEAREITESTIANVAVESNGVLYTPPVRCGLLPGTYRAWMLDQKRLQEKVLLVEDVLASPAVYLMNAVRRMQRVRVSASGGRASPNPRLEPVR